MPPRPRPSLTRARAPSDWAPVPLPFRHGLLAPVIGYAFQELRIGISLWLSDHWWHPIHDAPSVLPFEREVAGWDGRTSYNQRLLARTTKDRVTTLGEYGGFHDLFVPIQHADGMQGVLVVGPFLGMRPTSASILECWKRMSGAYGRLGDPLFSRYVSATMSTLVLEGAALDTFRTLLTSYAALLGGSGSSTAWAARAEEARQKLLKLRLPERSWEAARNLVDDRSMRPRFAPMDHGDLAFFGLKRAPENVIVGLTVARQAGGDPVALRVRHFEFQRECVSFARRQGGMLSGRVGDNAVMFLVERSSARSSALRRLAELTTRAAQLARRFGFALHAGIALESPSDLLPGRFRIALSAAQEALANGKTWIVGDATRLGSASLLRDLRAELGKSATDSPDLLAIRFRRYVEAVLARSGYRQESVRAELQVGVERLVDPLVAAGLIEPKSLHDLLAELAQSTESALSVPDLVAAHEALVAGVEAALRKPTAARQDRGMHRALAFIRDHLNEPITLGQTARMAGFAPKYFSRLFQREQGTTFARYRQRLRLEQAQAMLLGTGLSIDQIQKFVGFNSRTHFHLAFKMSVGKTPLEYRAGRT